MVRRIKIHEVARLSRKLSKISQRDFNALHGDMTGAQKCWLANGGLHRAAHRHVEFAFAIHAPEAVVAGLVEVNETGSYLNAVIKLMLAADAVIVFFRMIDRVLLQLANQWFGVALDDLVSVDEIKVNIT